MRTWYTNTCSRPALVSNSFLSKPDADTALSSPPSWRPSFPAEESQVWALVAEGWATPVVELAGLGMIASTHGTNCLLLTPIWGAHPVMASSTQTRW